jgi:uncharacterized protein
MTAVTLQGVVCVCVTSMVVALSAALGCQAAATPTERELSLPFT